MGSCMMGQRPHLRLAMRNSGNGRARVEWVVRAGLAAGLLLGGCAYNSMYPPPTTSQLASAESSVKAAQDSGGSTADPRATRHLRAAEQELAQAKQQAAA